MKRTYAIGDVHGELGMLSRALAWIDEDAGADPTQVVFLGDYIDRGPDSAGVVERLIAGHDRHEWVCLMGNHEDMLIESLVSEAMFLSWIRNGGLETTRSYDQKRFGGKMPDEHKIWMSELPQLHADLIGDRVFVHAGVDPTVPLREQTRQMLMWSRYDEAPVLAGGTGGTVPLICEETKRPMLVVHGHTPGRQPKYWPSVRLNLDTGACFSGSLSVAAWREGEVHPRVYMVNRYAARVKTWHPTEQRWVAS